MATLLSALRTRGGGCAASKSPADADKAPGSGVGQGLPSQPQAQNEADSPTASVKAATAGPLAALNKALEDTVEDMDKIEALAVDYAKAYEAALLATPLKGTYTDKETIFAMLTPRPAKAALRP